MDPQEPMAASAVSPSTLPTIMVSTVLYSCWNKLDTRMGSMNSSRFLKIGPCSRSAFWLKRFVFRGRVWVIGFLSSRKKEAVHKNCAVASFAVKRFKKFLFVVSKRLFHSSCCSNPLTVSTVRAVKPAALMAAAASSKPKVSAAVSWASAVMITLPPSLFHSPSSHAPG